MDATGDETIRLTVPATSAAVRITRAGAAALATRAGFTYREIEQLRLAVGEAAALLAPAAEGDGRLAVTYDMLDGGVRVDLRLTEAGATGLPAVPDVAAAVLDNSVDEWHLRDGGHRLVMVKRAAGDDDTDDV